MRTTMLLVVCMIATASRSARAQEDRDELAKDYRWEDAAKEYLTESQIKQLSRDKLVFLSEETHSQVVDGYYWSRLPPFVTSDSLLAGYHRLYEDTVIAMERHRVGQLAAVLRALWRGLDDPMLFFGDPEELVRSGRDRARFVIGVAMRLLNDEARNPASDAELAAEIDAEVRRIIFPQDAPGEPLDWLAGRVDYDRLNPRGFYTRSESLSRYFRAVAWLQEVPLFIDDDASLAAVIVLLRAVPDADATPTWDDQPARADFGAFWSFYNAYLPFVGGKDDWDLMAFAGVRFAPRDGDDERDFESLLDADGFADAREKLLAWWQAGRPYTAGLVGDVEASRTPEPDAEAADAMRTVRPNFRVLSALRTPDAVLFTHSADMAVFHRAFPNGLEVPAALGSDAAVALLRAVEDEHDAAGVIELVKDALVVEEPDGPADDFDEEGESDVEELAEGTLYRHYLYCLQSLLDAPEPEAPPLFASTPWQRKSIQSVCAGWAQLRHTWTLQAKESGGLFGGNAPLAGLVEPEPEFFRRMADLAERTERVLQQQGVLDAWRTEMAANLRAAADLIERKGFATRGAKALADLGASEREQLAGVIEHAQEFDANDKGRPGQGLFGGSGVGDEDEDADAATAAGKLDDAALAAAVALLAPRLRAIADATARGERVESPLAERFIPDGSDLRERWQLLADLARRLETITHKQLRGARFSPGDDKLLRDYAKRLGQVMDYGTPSSVPDDAPWVASVYHRQAVGNLQVATGRPTAMYLLYPYQGREVLCFGVVVPYHEFVSPNRLTDEAWRGMLDSGQAAPVAPWVREYYNDEELPEPATRRSGD